MPTFFCIHEGFYEGVQQRIESLQRACSKFSVQFQAMNALDHDYSSLPSPGPEDMVYNVARGGEILETLLLQSPAKSYYVNPPLLIENNRDTIKYAMVHDQTDLPTPKTIFHCNRDKKRKKVQVEHLGGFPVILKTGGGTKGVGTMIIPDMPSFLSITDFLHESHIPYIMREYIEPEEIARLIVIGANVVAANKKLIPEGDFRTSVDNQLPIPKRYSSDVEALAVAAAHSANFTNCGVDILIDKNGNPFILEVNMPHDYVTTEIATGIDIPGAMISYLLSK